MRLRQGYSPLMLVVAAAAGLKSALLVIFLVLLPTVPLTMLATGLLRPRRERKGEVVRGQSPATPFVLITVIGAGITTVVFAALLIAIGAQWLARSGGEHTDPLGGEAGGSRSLTTTDAQVPRTGQRNRREKSLFQQSLRKLSYPGRRWG